MMDEAVTLLAKDNPANRQLELELVKGNETVVLLIEDNPADRQLVLELVSSVENTSRLVPPFTFNCVTTLKQGLARLAEGGVDLVLLDLELPDSQGLDTFLKAFARNPTMPYVIISGHDDEELAIQAVREGAQDYLVKGELNGPILIRTMIYAIERKGAREKIREQYLFLECMLDSLTYPFYVLDVQEYTILKANSAANFGPDGIGGKCYTLTHQREEPCDDPEYPCPLKEVLRTKKYVATEHVHHDEDGNTRYTEVHGFPLFDADGNVTQMIEYNLDITEGKRLDQIIVETTKRERTRIGQDLHDGLGQLLAGIKYMCAPLEKELKEKAPEEAADISEIIMLLDEAIHQTQTLAHILCPVEVQPGGFMNLLEGLSSKIRRIYAIECRLDYEHSLIFDDYVVAAHLYYIVQEAVYNAIHHGKANQIIIKIVFNNGQTTLTVQDNGVGLPDDIDKLLGVGINSMKYRAKVVGASFSVKSEGTEGTVVECSWQDSQFQGRSSEE